MRAALLTSLLLCATSFASAQEAVDSIGFQGSLSKEEIIELTTPMRTEGSINREPIHNSFSPAGASEIKLGMLPPTERRYVISNDRNIYGIPKSSTLPRWATGYMYGYSSQSRSLMFGYTANAGMGIYQQLGEHFSINAGVDLNKYSVYYNTATFSGSVTWSPSRYLDITAFGSYMPGTFLSPIQLGSSFDWGGYLDIHTDTDVPFGVDLGAHTYYDPFVGHETTPIVRPYVKLGGSKIGIDFGPAIRNAVERSNGRNGNGIGVIPKPIKAIPQVAPRR